MIARYCAWCKPRRLLEEVPDGHAERIETDTICPACTAAFFPLPSLNTVEQLIRSYDSYASSNSEPTPQEMILEFRSRARARPRA